MAQRSRSQTSRTSTRRHGRARRGRWGLLLVGVGLGGLALYTLLTVPAPTPREEIDDASRGRLESVLRKNGGDER